MTSDPAKEDHGAWTPDGQWIAFQYDAGDNTDVWLVRPDGTDRRRLTTDAGRNGWPDWSPNGEWIVFSSDRTSGRDGNSEIYVMRADGSEQRRLTRTTDMAEERAAWSPAGSHLFSQLGSEDGGLARLEMSSGSVERLTSGDSFFGRPNVSPSGEWVVAERRSR